MTESQEKLEKLQLSKKNLLDKNFKILFFIDESEVANASVYEIYNQVKVLRASGYDAKLLTPKAEYKIPEYIDADLKALPHITSENNTFDIKPEDYLVIPELFTNIMEQTKKLPCTRIVLMQSFDNAMRGMLPGSTWYEFEIQNVITTSKTLSKVTNEFLGNFDIKEYIIGIPEYFNESKKPKQPLITFFSRNNNDMNKIVKMFYFKYPHFRWLSFEDLRGTNREDFAKKLKDSIACVWIDRAASFGTLPIEAMKGGTVPIGLIPDIQPEYINSELDNGFWTNDIMIIADQIAEAARLWLQYAIPEKVIQDMKTTADTYSVKNSNDTIIACYNYYFDKRINEFQNVITELSKVDSVLVD